MLSIEIVTAIQRIKIIIVSFYVLHALWNSPAVVGDSHAHYVKNKQSIFFVYYYFFRLKDLKPLVLEAPFIFFNMS